MNLQYKKITKANLTLAVVLLLIAVMLRLATLGVYPLMDTTEARYAEVAREMTVSNDWITPTINGGEVFWAKPPLSFWMTAISFRLFGLSEFSARLPSFLCGLLTLFLMYLFGKKLMSPELGIFSCVVLATSSGFFVIYGSVMTDAALLMTITLAMVGFGLSIMSSNLKESRNWGWMFFAGLGLSLLAKGPIGGVLILPPILIWLTWHRLWGRAWKTLPWKTGIPLTLVIALPWYIAAELKTPGFLEYFIVGEHFKRFLVSGWEGDLYGSGHSEPKGVIWFFLFICAFPWCLIVPFFVRSAMRLQRFESEMNWTSYLLLWGLMPAFFFTMASNILAAYVVPGLPGLALAATFMFLRMDTGSSESQRWFQRRPTLVTLALFVPLIFPTIGIPLLQEIGEKKSQKKLILLFEENEIRQTGDLIYLFEFPYSAQFYSQGGVKTIGLHDTEKILRELNDGDSDYFIFYPRFRERLPRELFEGTEPFGAFGKRAVVCEPTVAKGLEFTQQQLVTPGMAQQVKP